MPLPKLSHIVYPIEFKSVGLKTTFRPFTVAEEKILMHIKDSNDPLFIRANVKTLINNCVQDPVDVEKLATYDVENFMLRIRAKSVGETVDVQYTDPETKKVHKGKLDLENIRVIEAANHNPKIEIADGVGVIMRDPDFASAIAVQASKSSQADTAWKLVVQCIVSIYDATTVYVVGKDTTLEEVSEFVDTIPNTVSSKLIEYIMSAPRLEADITLDDGRVIPVTGLTNFLT